MFRQFLEQLRIGLVRFMAGRCGVDQLNTCLVLASLVINLMGSLMVRHPVPYTILRLISIALSFWFLFRFLSRNTSKRWAENQKFLVYFSRVQGEAREAKVRFQNRKVYLYCRCPKCGQKIRLPRGRGKIMARCPKCQQEFERRT